MFAQVKLLNGFQQPLTYKVPKELEKSLYINAIVTIPLQRRFEKALVITIFQELPSDCTFKIRAISEQDPFPADPHFMPFIKTLCSFYLLEPITILQRLTSFLKQKALTDEPVGMPPEENKAQPEAKKLTDEQENAVLKLLPFVTDGGFHPTLLQGVTGSGKTEVYLALISQALARNKMVLVLLPEVSLAIRFIALFSQRLGSEKVFGFHSATSASEKQLLWKTLLAEKPMVIIGVHLPVLLPLPNLGLIIIDEEHDVGYQEKKHPKVNSKEIALMRARQYNIPIVLGSATPSLQSLYQVEQKQWTHLKLTRRFSGAFPSIEVINLKDEPRRKQFWISKVLEEAITDRLAKKEQTIIFLNRRGYAFFVQCAQCSFIFSCPACSVSLTLHQDHTIRCHYCNHREKEPQSCPTCGPKAPLLKKGIGTQQVVALLQKMFPAARIERADMDSTINKKRWAKTIHSFTKGEIDILVGTQTITKGYHFPGVTLVGILWADMHLSLPVFNAAETTVQQLIQVAGRAGRQSQESKVIIQTFIKHPLFEHLDERNYELFYQHEITYRKQLNYPPLIRFAELEVRNGDEQLLIQETAAIAALLAKLKKNTYPQLIILGPAAPPVEKIKNIFMRKIYLKAPTFELLIKTVKFINEKEWDSTIFFTPHPLQ